MIDGQFILSETYSDSIFDFRTGLKFRLAKRRVPANEGSKKPCTKPNKKRKSFKFFFFVN